MTGRPLPYSNISLTNWPAMDAVIATSPSIATGATLQGHHPLVLGALINELEAQSGN